MKKFILLSLVIMSLGFSAIRLQGQSSVLGYGLGIGLGTQVIPVLLEMGIEGSAHTLPTFSTKGTYDGIAYDGELNSSMTRMGGYAKFHIPLINLIPILNFFAYPTIHAGTQSGYINVDGSVRLGTGEVFADRTQFQGSYALLGFPNYLGPLFIEPSVGTQHLAIPGVLNLESAYDAQIAIGVSF